MHVRPCVCVCAFVRARVRTYLHRCLLRSLPLTLSYLSDVWRSDNNGLDWTQLPNSSSFPVRAWFSATVSRGRLYVSPSFLCTCVARAHTHTHTRTHMHTHEQHHKQVAGGISDPTAVLNDLWYSEDGIIWVEASSQPWRGFYAGALAFASRPLYPLGSRVETL